MPSENPAGPATDAAHPSRKTGSEPVRLAAPEPSVARNALFLMLGQAATTALSIALSAALGRTFGAADFGILYVVTSMGNFAYVFVDWGQSQLLVREIARAPSRVGDLLGSALGLRVLAAMFSGSLAVAAAWALGYDARTRLLLGALAMALLPVSLAQCAGLGFRGLERMGLDSVVGVSVKALTLALTLAVFATGGRLFGAVFAQGLGGALGFGLALVLLRRQNVPALRVDPALWRHLLFAGAPLVLLTLGQHLQVYVEAVQLSKLAPPATAGWYAASRNFMNALIMPAAIIGSAIFPRLSREAHDPAGFARELRPALRPTILLAALGAVGTYQFADVAVNLVYGTRKFGPSADLLRFFAPVLFLYYIDMLLSGAVVALGRHRVLAGIKLASVGVVALFNLFLIPWFERSRGNGALGVVVAFGLAEVLMLLGSLALMPPGSLGGAFFADLARAAVAAAGTLALLGLLPAVPAWVAIPAVTIIFAAAAGALGLLRRADIDLALAAFRQR